MVTTNRDPWVALSRLSEKLGKALATNPAGLRDEDSNVVNSHWVPAVDIKEEADRFVLCAGLPGVEARDIGVTMEKGVLTIHGERPVEAQRERRAYSPFERPRGAFYRRFSLPGTADSDKVGARVSNGVLEVEIAKVVASKPRKIAVGE